MGGIVAPPSVMWLRPDLKSGVKIRWQGLLDTFCVVGICITSYAQYAHFVCLFIQVCAHAYLYNYACMPIFTIMHTCLFMQLYIHAYLYNYTYMPIYKIIHTCLFIQLCTHAYLYSHAHMPSYTITLTCLFIQSCTHAYFYSHAHMPSYTIMHTCLFCVHVLFMCLDKTVCWLLFYTIATIFQLYHGGDMMYEMRRRKPEPTLLPTRGIFNLIHHIGMV